MKQIFIKSTLLCLMFFLVISIKAQVTIGNNTQPEAGAILQLSDLPVQNSATSATATKGLQLPRVALKKKSDHTDVYKTINAPNTSSTPSSSWNVVSHIALTVYNVTDDPNEDLCPGVYVWEGNMWVKLGPPCVEVPTLSIKDGTIIIDAKNPFIFNSGVTQIKNGESYTTKIPEKKLSVNWTPNNIPLIVEEEEEVPYVPNNIVFKQLTSSYNTGGQADVNITPDNWDSNNTIKSIITNESNPISNGGYNPFYYEKTKLKFKVTNSAGTVEKQISIIQVQKNVILIGYDYTKNQIIVQSNGMIRVVVKNSVGTVYKEIGVYGSETLDPSTITINVPSDLEPDSNIIIEDYYSNRSFNRASSNRENERFKSIDIKL